ncbi:MAG: isoprenylcysteine carboxylmethyltransferase family protein [Actinobacteria bacterium]|nr:isoprenylcysteine carboxylmethyltransferase family protein [Actinomycetota bacterium]
MLPWLNVAVMVGATILTFVFYVASVRPAALSRRIGAEAAYRTCTRFRVLSAVMMTVVGINYVVYAFFPLPWSFPKTFPWPYWVSALIAVVIAIPSGIVFARGMKDAGEETMVLKEQHTMYGGIYEKIRHPQAAGEVWYWWVIAFLCHSPFLAIYSFVWLPLFHLMSRAEERDLLIRYGDDYRAYRERTGMYLPRRAHTGS